MAYNLGGMTFGTQENVVARVRDILKHYRNNEQLSDADLAFAIDLLRLHPEYERKAGCGIESVYVAENPIYPGSRGLWVRRTDGTSTDFSYKKCLRARSHKEKVTMAMRAAIEPDTFAFKQATFDAPGEVVRCPDTGEVLTFTTAHVDHKSPYTFARLSAQFLDEAGIGWDDIAVIPSADGKIGEQLSDAKLRESWVSWHRSHAVLEVVSVRANLVLRRSKAPEADSE